MFLSARLIALAIVCACSSAASADVRSDVKAIFAQDMENIDLARARLELDRLVMPSVDVEAELAQIDAMATELAAMVPAGAGAWAKVEVLRRYLYEAGPLVCRVTGETIDILALRHVAREWPGRF